MSKNQFTFQLRMFLHKLEKCHVNNRVEKVYES